MGFPLEMAQYFQVTKICADVQIFHRQQILLFVEMRMDVVAIGQLCSCTVRPGKLFLFSSMRFFSLSSSHLSSTIILHE